jgi:hypothetical protein
MILTVQDRADRAHEAVRAYVSAPPGGDFHLIDLLSDLGHWKDVHGAAFDRGDYDFPEAVVVALRHYYEESLRSAATYETQRRLMEIAADQDEMEALDALMDGAQLALETGESADVHQALFHLVEALALPEDEDEVTDDA